MYLKQCTYINRIYKMKISFFRFFLKKQTLKCSFQYLRNYPLNVLELTGMNFFSMYPFPPREIRYPRSEFPRASLSAFPPTRARALAELRLVAPAGRLVALHNGGVTTGRHNGRRAMGKMMQNEKCHFYSL